MTDKRQAIERLERQLGLIDELKKKPPEGSDFTKWRRDTVVAIEHIFGRESRHLKDFEDANFGIDLLRTGWGQSADPHSKGLEDTIFDVDLLRTEASQNVDPQRLYIDNLDHVAAVLRSFIQEIEEYGSNQTMPEVPGALAKVESLCKQFHLVAMQLRSRHNDRAPFAIRDEYDVQDLLHALLNLHFDDIRTEERTPSHAGSSARMDFLLKQEAIVIETKMAREKLRDKEVGEELIIDIKKYQNHPDCRMLFCFVYDPDNRIGNPRGLENDLSKSEEGFQVRVLVAPTGL